MRGRKALMPSQAGEGMIHLSEILEAVSTPARARPTAHY
jgi:hypothetical protein